MGKAKKTRQYGRLRGDSGQHRRILVVALLLGVLLFIPAVLRLYDLMILQYGY